MSGFVPTSGVRWIQLRATIRGVIKLIDAETCQGLGEVDQKRAENPQAAVEHFMSRFPQGASLPWYWISGELVCFTQMEVEVLRTQ